MTAQIKVPIVVNMSMGEIIERLKKDDFVQVVRCKDCVFRKGNICKLYIVETHEVNDDDFCSEAERREHETD